MDKGVLKHGYPELTVSVAASSEYPQQKQEQVYEIEVKTQGADDRPFSFLFGPGESGICHCLYCLGVVGGKPDENGYACIGYQPVESWSCGRRN